MPSLSFTCVTVRRDEKVILRDLDWTVEAGERWVVLGPNGSGKTTALRLAGAQLHPSSGQVNVLGHTLGRVDIRDLRKRIGLVSGAVNRSLRPDLSAFEVVLTGKNAALEPAWDDYDTTDNDRAHSLLRELGVASSARRAFGVVSEGERQQILLARVLMAEPELLLLDEPFAGLDLGAREGLLSRLTSLASMPSTPSLVLVTHHLEEIPPGITHAALLRDGQWVATGPLEDVVTSAAVSECFATVIQVDMSGGRWRARAGS